MAFATAEDLVELRAKDRVAYLYSYDSQGYSMSVPYGTLDMEAARGILAANLAATLRNSQGKYNRPWCLVDIFSKLDPNEVWIGMEMETGFNNEDHYKQLVQYIWDDLSYVAMDREGSGYYPIEVTFPPEELSKFARGEAQINKMLDFMNDKKLNNIVPAESHVTGTHVNISTPKFRTMADNSRRDMVARAMTYTLQTLNAAQRVEFFNRQPYGWCYRRNAASPSGVQEWIEMKLFFSTTDRVKFGEYMATIERISLLIDKLIDHGSLDRIAGGYCQVSNAASFLRGETDDINTNY